MCARQSYRPGISTGHVCLTQPDWEGRQAHTHGPKTQPASGRLRLLRIGGFNRPDREHPFGAFERPDGHDWYRIESGLDDSPSCPYCMLPSPHQPAQAGFVPLPGAVSTAQAAGCNTCPGCSSARTRLGSSNHRPARFTTVSLPPAATALLCRRWPVVRRRSAVFISILLYLITSSLCSGMS